MLTLYGAFRSRITRNLWLAYELGLDFTHVPVLQAYRLKDPQAADAPLNTQSAAFLAISPQGAIPVMDEDGFVLTESFAINLYLAKTRGGDLGPRDVREEALMLQWSLYAATSIEAAALATMYVVAEKRDATPEGRAEMVEMAEKLRRPLKVLNGHFAAHQTLVGERFTVADINMAEVVRYAQANGPLMDEFPNLKAWIARCQSRPAFKLVMERRAAEPV